MGRFLPWLKQDRRWVWAMIFAMSIPAKIAWGVLAWKGSETAIVFLVLFSIVWIVFAGMNSVHWKGTLNSWGRTLLAWKETGELVNDLWHMLDEACAALDTWDRERADDIRSRATTVSLMRSQNITGKVGKE